MNDSSRVADATPAASRIDGRGLSAALAAFLMWGLFPLYMKLLQAVPVLQFTAHRMAWGFLFGFCWLAWRGEVSQMWQALGDPQTRLKLCASAAFIAINWSIFMWGIATNHVVEISLGYFIGPLLNVALGVVCFRERLNRVQWLSVMIAAAAVLYLTWSAGRPPYVSLALALTFGLYGLVRKVAKVEALPGFTGETLILLPFAAGYVIWCELTGVGAMSQSSLGINLLLLLGGPLTAVPLVLFAVGARRIPLFTVGLLQYIAPSLQLMCAVLVFGEPFSGPRVVGFAMIWTALGLFALDGLRVMRRRARL
ncbi:EamA family transporter RarD [Steroidobacter sp. S1-65]|uniref:EamA family transporter RarD n=1 Tax=Steroidobacter gossypii TaxID=2805490 RepID=A0ABS1WSH3_9GAMM|nr:EamA family transporter RarD [Steroidobacter gossypii]MBM0103927.1 EamA family transporter RarD [Steroidobacter gossypii]